MVRTFGRCRFCILSSYSRLYRPDGGLSDELLGDGRHIRDQRGKIDFHALGAEPGLDLPQGFAVRRMIGFEMGQLGINAGSLCELFAFQITVPHFFQQTWEVVGEVGS